MTIPVLNSDLTLIDIADTQTNWSGWGANAAKWGVEADIVLEGAGSLGLAPAATGDGGYGFTTAANINLATNRLLIWVYVTPGFVDVAANYGVYVRVTTSAADWVTDYLDFKVGGSDVAWVGRGWHLIALDCNRTPDRSAGSTVLSTIRQVGVGFNMLATASKSTIVAIDILRYGNYVEVTTPYLNDGTNGIDFNDNGGSDDTIVRQDAGSWITDGFEAGSYIHVSGTVSNDGVYQIKSLVALTITLETGSLNATEADVTAAYVEAYCTFEDIYTKDGPTDDNWYGIVTQTPVGPWEINYRLNIGDVSGALHSHFISLGDVVYFADQVLSISSAQQEFRAIEDTGVTRVLFGESLGTGDTRVGYNGPSFFASAIFGGSACEVELSDTITDLLVYGVSFTNITDGIPFSTSTGHRVFNTTFTDCGQVDGGAVEMRNCSFIGYGLDANAALLWNGSINIKNSSFVANQVPGTTIDPHAIEHPVQGSFDYYGLTFSGNDYDIYYTAAASAGVLTINANESALGIKSDPSTYEILNLTGNSVSIINTVTLTIEVIDNDGAAVENARCSIFKESDDTELMNELSLGTGLAQESFNYAAATDIYWRVRKSSTGTTRYKNRSGTGQITANGFSVVATLEVEPVS